MSMGYCGSKVNTISEENIKKFCQEKYDNLISFIHEVELDLEEFARNARNGDLESYDDKIKNAYKELQKDFQDKTGLEIYIGYHNSEEEGDKYDEVDGIFWEVIGVYKYTPAGKKMKDYIEEKSYVVFG